MVILFAIYCVNYGTVMEQVARGLGTTASDPQFGQLLTAMGGENLFARGLIVAMTNWGWVGVV